MSMYWRRLQSHPGVPVACMLTIIGGFAGLSGGGGLMGFLSGAALFALVFWPIVLWTARTQPIEEDKH